MTWDQTVVYPLDNVSTTADLVLGYKEEGSTSLNLRKFGVGPSERATR